MTTTPDWPWYEVIADDTLDQGDIIPGCRVLHALDVETDDEASLVADLRPIRALVLTQTCDLAQKKIESVVVCAVWSLAEMVLQDASLRKHAADTAARLKLDMPQLGAADQDAAVYALVQASGQLRNEFNAVIKGERPALAMLEKHDSHPSASLSVASFRHIYSVPRAHLERSAKRAAPRLRLRPPYREHVSHAFGRFFSRIGLLQDIRRL